MNKAAGSRPVHVMARNLRLAQTFSEKNIRFSYSVCVRHNADNLVSQLQVKA
jgi:hypothetical protein